MFRPQVADTCALDGSNEETGSPVHSRYIVLTMLPSGYCRTLWQTKLPFVLPSTKQQHSLADKNKEIYQFQVNLWNHEFVRGAKLRIDLALSFPITSM